MSSYSMACIVTHITSLDPSHDSFSKAMHAYFLSDAGEIVLWQNDAVRQIANALRHGILSEVQLLIQ